MAPTTPRARAGTNGGQGSNSNSDNNLAAQCRRRRRPARGPIRFRARSRNGPMPVIVCALPASGAPPLRPPPPPAPAPAAPAPAPVAFGSVALAGRMREMEDVVALRPGLCVWAADGSPVHFFAVFDGHGGRQVAEMRKEQMPEMLKEELAAAAAALLKGQPAPKEEEDAWREALRRAFARVDASCCGDNVAAAVTGSTAVVALLVRDLVVVANCGDSRAVISGGHDGKALALSADHKPDRQDEMQRIKEAGGQVIFNNGARVRGILAMSRAIGHRMLKPEVICDPEILMIRRSAGDDCLILASDGVWDVITNQMACDVVRQCLQDGSPPDLGLPAQQQSSPRCDIAAAALGRLALGRESKDNISAVVIDLKRRE